MTKIFKQLARHWAVCLVVFALLFVQAYCDLSLPDYTSRIVDTGIQQGGIESPLPETIRQSTLDALTLLMSEEDADALQNAQRHDAEQRDHAAQVVLHFPQDVFTITFQHSSHHSISCTGTGCSLT